MNEYIKQQNEKQKTENLAALEKVRQENIASYETAQATSNTAFQDAMTEMFRDSQRRQADTNAVLRANSLNEGAGSQAALSQSNAAMGNEYRVKLAKKTAEREIELAKKNNEEKAKAAVQQAIANQDYNTANQLYAEYQDERKTAQEQVDRLISAGVMPDAELIGKSGYSSDYVSARYNKYQQRLAAARAAALSAAKEEAETAEQQTPKATSKRFAQIPAVSNMENDAAKRAKAAADKAGKTKLSIAEMAAQSVANTQSRAIAQQRLNTLTNAKERVDYVNGLYAAGAIDKQAHTELSMISTMMPFGKQPVLSTAQLAQLKGDDAISESYAQKIASTVGGGAPLKLPTTATEAKTMLYDYMAKQGQKAIAEAAATLEERTKYLGGTEKPVDVVWNALDDIKNGIDKDNAVVYSTDHGKNNKAEYDAYWGAMNDRLLALSKQFDFGYTSPEEYKDQGMFATEESVKRNAEKLEEYFNSHFEDEIPSGWERAGDTAKSVWQETLGVLNMLWGGVKGAFLTGDSSSMTYNAESAEAAKKAVADANAKASELFLMSEESLAEAKKYASDGTKFAIDLGKVALEVLEDAAVSAVTSGAGGLANMALRTYGSTYFTSVAGGMDESDAMLLAVERSAMGVLTERLGGLKFYGGGKVLSKIESKILPDAMAKLEKNYLFRTVVKGGMEESLEELIENVGNNYADVLMGFRDDASMTDEEMSELLYEMLIASIIGFAGANVEIGADKVKSSRAKPDTAEIVDAATDTAISNMAQKGKLSEQTAETLQENVEQRAEKRAEAAADTLAETTSQNAPQADVVATQQTTPQDVENGTGEVKTANAENTSDNATPSFSEADIARIVNNGFSREEAVEILTEREKIRARRNSTNAEININNPNLNGLNVGDYARIGNEVYKIIRLYDGGNGRMWFEGRNEAGVASNAPLANAVNYTEEQNTIGGFIGTIGNKAQKTKAKKAITTAVYSRVEALANNPNVRVDVHQNTRNIGGQERTFNEYRAYGVVEDSPNAYQTLTKNEYGLYSYMVANSQSAQEASVAEQPLTPNPDGLGGANAGFTDRPMTQGEQWVAEAQNIGDSAVQPISDEQMSEVIARGEMPQDIPKVDLNGHLTSKTVSTVANSGVTTQEMAEAIVEDAAQGKFSRIPYTDQAAISKAEAEIEDVGWEQAIANYEAKVAQGIGGKDMAVMGIVLYNNAVTKGDYATAMDILALMVKVSTSNAQGVQAMRILNKLSPDSRLYMAFKSVEAITREIKAKYNLEDDITIDPDLVSAYRDALMNGEKTAIREAWGNIEQNIADQIPPTWRDKLNAWRYLSMLGNPRTHVRNIVGNLGFMPVRAVKDVIATALEMGVDKISGGKIDRTKAMLNPASAADRALIATAWADYANASEAIMSGGKFNDLPNTVDDRRRIFAFKPLEGARKFNTNALNVEDKWFSQPAYAAALAGYLKANGISAQDYANGNIADDVAAKAQTYAVKEAQKATYRDTNRFSEAITSIARYAENKGGLPAKVLIEGVLPFKKTPANILARAVEYSPIGLTAYMTEGTYRLAKGDITAAKFIDGLASGLTGTGILMLGVFLARAGLLSGGGDDDRELEKLQGVQDYSLNVGGKSYTLDWLAPEALPLFVGVELYNNVFAKDETASVWDLIDSLGNITEPLFEMSMLQGVSDLIDTVGYADKPIFAVATNAATSYISQFIPTIGGQIERSFTEDTRQSTFIDKNSETPSDIQYFLGQMFNKVPGVEYQQMGYVDAWGRKQETGNMFERMANNFFNPAYVNDIRVEAAEGELNRLAELGYSVMPQKPSQSVQINGKYLTAEQYQTYAKEVGQTSLNTVNALIESGAYKYMSDADKAAAIADCYTYAKGVSQLKIDGNTDVASWVTKAKASGNPADAIAYRAFASNADNYKDTISAAAKAGLSEQTILNNVGTDKGVGKAYTEYKNSNPNHVSLEEFADAYYYKSNEATGTDNNNDGKTDRGSVKADVERYLEEQGYTASQVAALMDTLY